MFKVPYLVFHILSLRLQRDLVGSGFDVGLVSFHFIISFHLICFSLLVSRSRFISFVSLKWWRMSRFNLIYFPCRGRQEPAQLLLELGGFSYETSPVNVETWKEDKTEFVGRSAFGQLPILEDRERKLELSQSQTIYRYLADLADLNGRNVDERIRIDELCETVTDLTTDLLLITWDAKQFSDLPAHRARCKNKLSQFESFFRKHGGTTGSFIAGYVSLADVRCCVFLEALAPLHKGLMEDEFPFLNEYRSNFFERNEKVKAFVESQRRFKTYTISMAVWGGKEEETVQRVKL